MTWDEYNKLFHKLQLNLVAFKMLFQVDEEVLKLVNAAIEQEREACARVCEEMDFKSENAVGSYIAGWSDGTDDCAAAIRARGDNNAP